MKKTFFILLFFSLVTFPIVSNEQKGDLNIICSTSWVASIAELAGIDSTTTIAPSNLKHPPEYEITANDIVNLVNADLILHAGYERMVKVMAASSDIPPSRLQKVKTTNTLSNLETMVKMLSEKAGTQEISEIRFSEYKKMIENARIEIKKHKLDQIPVYVHKDQAEFAKDLGLMVVDTFGSKPLTSEQIAFAAKEKFVLVIDNYHNPVASPIKAVSKNTKIITWKNFPDFLGNNALYTIVKSNIAQLFEF